MPEKPRPVAQSISDVPTATPPAGQTPVFRPPSGPSTTHAATRAKPAAGVIQELQPGLMIAIRYQLEEKLGEGGMGLVFRALDSKLKRPVVLKFVRPDLVSRPDMLQRLFDEAEAAAKLSHRHAVTVHDQDSDPSLGPFLVLEFVDGPNLLELLEQNGEPLSVDHAVKYICQAGEALQAAHDVGIVHRDVKPSNILISPQDEAKLSDFGIARLNEDASGGHTQTGAVLGTLDFMAPEQLRDPRNASPASDQYSLAATLYQLVTGESPRFMDAELIPHHVRQLLRQALRREATQRFGSVREFCERLEQAVPTTRSARVVPTSHSSEPAPVAPVSPQSGTNVLELFEKLRADASAAHEQARQALSREAYADAVRILEAIEPAEFRDVEFLNEARLMYAAAEAEAKEQREETERKRRRMWELTEQIESGMKTGKLSGLAEAIDELLTLEPQRDDLRTLRAKLDGLVITPGHHTRVASGMRVGTKATRRGSNTEESLDDSSTLKTTREVHRHETLILCAYGAASVFLVLSGFAIYTVSCVSAVCRIH